MGGFHNWLQAYKEEQDGFWTYEFLEDDCNVSIYYRVSFTKLG